MNILTLQLRTTEVPQNLLPVRRVLEASKVGLQLAGQNLERGTLANTVGTDQTKDLSRAGHRKTVQLEAVGGVTVCDLALEVGGQVDNLDGVEGALLGADTASDTQALRDEGDFAGVVDFDTQLAGLDDGTRLLALLTTFLRLALVRVDDGDTVEEYELCVLFAGYDYAVTAVCGVVGGCGAGQSKYSPGEFVAHGCGIGLLYAPPRPL